MKIPAVFLDRDGTIIEDAGYIGDPQEVRLLPGAGEAVRRMAAAGHRIVLVSNQSGVARGLFSEADLNKVHRRVEALLSEEGARLDRAYYCPYLDGPEAVVEAFRRDSELRKPKPGMLLQAAQELGLDLARSWMIGNSPADVEAGTRAGCRTILLAENGLAPPVDVTPNFKAATLLEAAAIVERETNESVVPPASASAAPRDARPGSRTDDPIVEALDRIHEQLERSSRSGRQHDFSSLRLAAALLQMLAIVAALWGLIALMDESASATGRLALACFFQLASLTAFLTDRLR